MKTVCRKLGVIKWPYRELRILRHHEDSKGADAEAGESKIDNSEDDEEEFEAGAKDRGSLEGNMSKVCRIQPQAILMEGPSLQNPAVG